MVLLVHLLPYCTGSQKGYGYGYDSFLNETSYKYSTTVTAELLGCLRINNFGKIFLENYPEGKICGHKCLALCEFLLMTSI